MPHHSEQPVEPGWCGVRQRYLSVPWHS